MTCGYCGAFWCWRCEVTISGYDHFKDGQCRLFEQAEIDRWNAMFAAERAAEAGAGAAGGAPMLVSGWGRSATDVAPHGRVAALRQRQQRGMRDAGANVCYPTAYLATSGRSIPSLTNPPPPRPTRQGAMGAQRVRVCHCPGCGQANFSPTRLNLHRCWSCAQHFCAACHTLLRGRVGQHFIGARACKQHG